MSQRYHIVVVTGEPAVADCVCLLIHATEELELVGVAADLHHTVSYIQRRSPDVVLIDAGHESAAETVSELSAWDPTLTIVPVGYTTEHVSWTGCVQLPSNLCVTSEGDGADKTSRYAELLSAGVRAAHEQHTGANRASAPDTDDDAENDCVLTSLSGRSRYVVPNRLAYDIIAVGASTGGPAALAGALGPLPADFPVPIFIAQHVPPTFGDSIASQLAAHLHIKVRLAKNGVRLEAGHAYVAPGNKHIEIVRANNTATIRLHDGPLVNSCRPSVDVLFKSVSRSFSSRAIAVVLTGMGSDGFAGCKMLHEAGAVVLAQDQETSVVWGMPGVVSDSALADRVLPLQQIAPALAHYLGLATVAKKRAA